MIRNRAARQKAHDILKMFRLHEPPIDVEKIAKLLDFKVVYFDFPEEIPAVIKIDMEKKLKVIGVRKDDHPNRQRFSIAHELGHYLSGHDSFIQETKSYIPDKKYLDPTHREEEEADEFAAELLMPEFMLKDDVIVNKLSAHDLAEKYKVSEQAMWIQLINLRLPTKNL